MTSFKKPLLYLNLTLLSVSIFGVSLFANPHDPLSLDEILKVSALTTSAKSPSFKMLANEVLHKDKTSVKKAKEILLVERHEEEKNAPKNLRRADIFIYDYETNELIESLVDLTTSEIVSTKRSKGIQLPLTEAELERAKKIVFDDEDEREILAYEYQRITSQPMTDTTELNIKAFTFTADSLPNRVNEASKVCGVHRCAQLMLYTGENIVFEISPIVNLSEGIVTQRIGF